MSLLEIYNESVRDLLGQGKAAARAAKESARAREKQGLAVRVGADGRGALDAALLGHHVRELRLCLGELFVSIAHFLIQYPQRLVVDHSLTGFARRTTHRRKHLCQNRHGSSSTIVELIQIRGDNLEHLKGVVTKCLDLRHEVFGRGVRGQRTEYLVPVGDLAEGR